MWLTSGSTSGRKNTLLNYSSLLPLERECYEEEVQPYRKTDNKQVMMIMYHNIRNNPLEQIYLLTVHLFLLYVLTYFMFMFLMYNDLHAQFSFST